MTNFFFDKKKKNSTKQEKRGRGKTRVHPFSGICSRKSLTSIRYSRSHPRLTVNPQFIRIERPVWMLVEFHHKLNLNIFLIIHNMCSVRLSQVTCVWLIYKRESECEKLILFPFILQYKRIYMSSIQRSVKLKTSWWY